MVSKCFNCDQHYVQIIKQQVCDWSDRNQCIDFVQTIDLEYGKLYFDSKNFSMSPEIKYTKVTKIVKPMQRIMKTKSS